MLNVVYGIVCLICDHSACRMVGPLTVMQGWLTILRMGKWLRISLLVEHTATMTEVNYRMSSLTCGTTVLPTTHCVYVDWLCVLEKKGVQRIPNLFCNYFYVDSNQCILTRVRNAFGASNVCAGLVIGDFLWSCCLGEEIVVVVYC